MRHAPAHAGAHVEGPARSRVVFDLATLVIDSAIRRIASGSLLGIEGLPEAFESQLQLEHIAGDLHRALADGRLVGVERGAEQLDGPRVAVVGEQLGSFSGPLFEILAQNREDAFVALSRPRQGLVQPLPLWLRAKAF